MVATRFESTVTATTTTVIARGRGHGTPTRVLTKSGRLGSVQRSQCATAHRARRDTTPCRRCRAKCGVSDGKPRYAPTILQCPVHTTPADTCPRHRCWLSRSHTHAQLTCIKCDISCIGVHAPGRTAARNDAPAKTHTHFVWCYPLPRLADHRSYLSPPCASSSFRGAGETTNAGRGPGRCPCRRHRPRRRRLRPRLRRPATDVTSGGSLPTIAVTPPGSTTPCVLAPSSITPCGIAPLLPIPQPAHARRRRWRRGPVGGHAVGHGRADVGAGGCGCRTRHARPCSAAQPEHDARLGAHAHVPAAVPAARRRATAGWQRVLVFLGARGSGSGHRCRRGGEAGNAFPPLASRCVVTSRRGRDTG